MNLEEAKEIGKTRKEVHFDGDKIPREGLINLLAKALDLRTEEERNKPHQSQVVNFPVIQKIEGETKAEVKNWPDIFKVAGEVVAKVIFPTIQKISGEVTAKIENWPVIQKIVGVVDSKVTNFPDVQKVQITNPTQKVEVTGETQVSNLPIGEGEEASTKTANPSRYVPVRLTDGRKFYSAMQEFVAAAGGMSAKVRNFIDSFGKESQALVDTDHHLQVDVQTLPTVTVEAADLDIRNLSQTQDAIVIYGSDDGGTTKRAIKTDSGGAIQVDLEVANVTVNNASGASAVNIQDGGNTITVDGIVSANATLSAETTKVIGTVNIAGSQTIAVTNAGTFATQATLQTGSAAIGKLAVNSGVDIGDVDVTSIATGTNAIGRVGHDITGIGHGVTTVTTAGTDVVLAASTPCKKVVIQSQTDNTTGIAVGASGVDATIATGTGIFLYPGDVIELEIDNLADIYIDSLTNGEGVRYSYFT